MNDTQRQIDELTKKVQDLSDKLDGRANGLSAEQIKMVVDTIKESMDDVITEDMKTEWKDVFNNITSEKIQDILWYNIFFTSSMNGPAATTTSASELFTLLTREADTSGSEYLSEKRVSKFRCLFYFNGTDALDSTAYIGSMGTFNDSTGLTSINQAGMEYLALKSVNGTVTIVGKNESDTTEKSTNVRITDDTTYILEIHFFPKERADFYIDGTFVGSITESLPKQKDVVTFLPLMVSITRGGATNRTVTVESWEFIQSRK